MPLPHIIVLATGKGGAGKSTMARSLAGHWLMSGLKPGLLDADPQASVSTFFDPTGPMKDIALGVDPEAESIRHTVKDMAATTNPLIIDTAGFRNKTTVMAAVLADLVLIPLKPAAEDVREAVAMADMIAEINGTPERKKRPIQVMMVLTMTVPGTVIGRHVRKELEQKGYPLLEAELTQRVAYPELSMRGLSPSVVDPDGAAARDIARIAAEITKKGGLAHGVKAA